MPCILVTGSNGQLGSEIAKISKEYGSFSFLFVGRKEMPLDNTLLIADFLDKAKPGIIINAGAYTAVDQAEKEKKLADQINNKAVSAIATWCAANNAKLIHISTDYVFNGTSKNTLKESDTPDPINWYGETKLRGERAIQDTLKNAIIIRTSWVYSEYGKNFVKTILRLLKEKEEISVVDDQFGSPTYALDLAKAIMAIITADVWKAGVYHYSNEGEISWYNFAVAINELCNLDCRIVPVTSEKFPTLAKRPNYSLLDKSKIKEAYKVTVPYWEDSLRQCLTIVNPKK